MALRCFIAFRFLIALIPVFLFAGCAGEHSIAPVDDRAVSSPKTSGHWHTVKTGDTLFSIAFSHGEDYKDVANRNGIFAPYVIYPGQRLLLQGHSQSSSKSTAKSKPATRKSATKSSSGKASKATTVNKQARRNIARISWSWPVTGQVIRSYSASAPRKKGIGIGGKLGQNVHAAATGKVVYSGDGLIGYGNLIIIKHDDIYLSAYAHCRKVLVKEGQQVSRGQKIATMGENENNKPMLHFEIRKNGKPVNPEGYLPKS